MFYQQLEFDVRCEWGRAGVSSLAAQSDAVIIVDVLSFSTCVDIACGNGASVYPCCRPDVDAADYARHLGAELAGARESGSGGYWLSPGSLLTIPGGTRLVLPSPNGATLSLMAGQTPVFTGCLRNARAVAQAAQKLGRRISLIPAGERWPGGSLRPAIEDLLGAGAMIVHLAGSRSAEAEVAAAAFTRFQETLLSCLEQCSSGKELRERGRVEDVRLAAALNQSECAPALREQAYVKLGSQELWN